MMLACLSLVVPQISGKDTPEGATLILRAEQQHEDVRKAQGGIQRMNCIQDPQEAEYTRFIVRAEELGWEVVPDNETGYYREHIAACYFGPHTSPRTCIVTDARFTGDRKDQTFQVYVLKQHGISWKDKSSKLRVEIFRVFRWETDRFRIVRYKLDAQSHSVESCTGWYERRMTTNFMFCAYERQTGNHLKARDITLCIALVIQVIRRRGNTQSRTDFVESMIGKGAGLFKKHKNFVKSLESNKCD